MITVTALHYSADFPYDNRPGPVATRRQLHSARAVHSIIDEDLRVSTHKSIIKTLGRQYTDAAQFFVELVVNSWMWGEATKVEVKIADSGSQIEYEEWGRGMDLDGLRDSSPREKQPARVSHQNTNAQYANHMGWEASPG